MASIRAITREGLKPESHNQRHHALVVDLEALPLSLRPALSVPADAVHVAEELQAVPFRIVEVEGVVVARPFVLDLAAHVHALRSEERRVGKEGGSGLWVCR